MQRVIKVIMFCSYFSTYKSLMHHCFVFRNVYFKWIVSFQTRAIVSEYLDEEERAVLEKNAADEENRRLLEIKEHEERRRRQKEDSNKEKSKSREGGCFTNSSL